MECAEARPRLDPYLDDELAEGDRGLLRDHLAGCADCAAAAAALEHLREGIRREAPSYRAPAALRSQIRSALRHEAAAPSPWRVPGMLAYAASLLLAVAFGAGGAWYIGGEHQQDRIAAEIIDGHLGSLLGSHLTDVESSDTHTVKPWFAGRTELSPPGVDLAAQGFPLIGGRLDVIDGKPVPVLVYRAGKHVINVFVLPKRKDDLGETVTRGGYTLRHWTQGDLGYWAVSDASPDEFAQFERRFRAAIP